MAPACVCVCACLCSSMHVSVRFCIRVLVYICARVCARVLVLEFCVRTCVFMLMYTFFYRVSEWRVLKACARAGLFLHVLPQCRVPLNMRVRVLHMLLCEFCTRPACVVLMRCTCGYMSMFYLYVLWYTVMNNSYRNTDFTHTRTHCLCAHAIVHMRAFVSVLRVFVHALAQ